jgi:hypothetical protein
MQQARIDVVKSGATARGAAARDLAQTAALREVLRRFEGAQLPVLIMKGAALSLSVYADVVRPRNDDDLLVAPQDFARAAAALQAAGYVADTQVTDAVLTGQQLFARQVFGLTHFVDLHARPLNPRAFEHLPSFEALLASSVPIPSLGPHRRAVGRVHALLLACAHRVAHHTPTEDPTWLVDVDRLARTFAPHEWPRFVDVAVSARCAQICGSELRRSQATHGTPIPVGVLQTLDRVTGEPSARHLRPLGPLHTEWLNIRHARSWSDRAALVTAHLFPSADYMRARFGVGAGQSLARAYVRRLLSGGSRWLREFAHRVWRAR